jgi:hypothetical protein
MAFTRTVDASSAPRDFTSPSFCGSYTGMKGIPSFTATVLNNRIDGLVPFFRTGKYFELLPLNDVYLKIISNRQYLDFPMVLS